MSNCRLVAAFATIVASMSYAAASLAAQAFEGVITVKITGRGTARGEAIAPQLVEFLSRGTRGTRVNITGQMGSMSMLTLPAEKKMFMLLESRSMYVEMPLAEDGLPAGTPNIPVPKITRTGKTETIAGYSCEHVSIEAEHETNDVCMTKGLGALMNLSGGMGLKNAPSWQRSLAADGAFPLKVTNAAGVTTLEVTKIEKKKLSDALFTIPLNYTKMAGAGRRPS